MEDFLALEGVSKSFGTTRAVDGVSLAVRRGEVFSLLGPSGCGKTTLLRLAAGFEAPDAGAIRLEGRDITRLPPERRAVNTIFQHYALFPHLTVAENIAFGPRLARRERGEITREVDAMLDLVRLREQAKRRPAELSGGQKQRVAIARALINKPQVLLLDEPLAALDLKLRQHMVAELHRLHEEVGITFLYVTHDQEEAMALSDRIAVMNHGRIEQVGAPRELYETPATGFVAEFIGDANLLAGTVSRRIDGEVLEIEAPGLGRILATARVALGTGDAVRVMIRPEKVRISAGAPPGAAALNAFAGTVRAAVYQGARMRWTLDAGGASVVCEGPTPPGSGAGFGEGSQVWMSFAAAEVLAIPPEAPGRA